MSCDSRPTSSGSPACRWSRAPRSGAYDPATGRYTLYAGGGAVVRPKKELAIILGIEPEQVRVIAREIGGNFGTRNFFYPEFVLVAWAAKKIGRPVKWTCERGEAFLSDYAGRDLQVESELALDRPTASFLGLHASSDQQSRRLYRLVHAADQGHAAHDQRLPHAGDGAGARRCSATRRRPRPIAAPAGRRPCS